MYMVHFQLSWLSKINEPKVPKPKHQAKVKVICEDKFTMSEEFQVTVIFLFLTSITKVYQQYNVTTRFWISWNRIE